jgi:hypothetical protein
MDKCLTGTPMRTLHSERASGAYAAIQLCHSSLETYALCIPFEEDMPYMRVDCTVQPRCSRDGMEETAGAPVSIQYESGTW